MKSIIILSSGLMSASPVGATIPQIVQKNNVDINVYLTSILPILNKEINIKNKAQIKNILLSALRENNGALSLDQKQMVTIGNQKLETIFLSTNFYQIINQLYVSKIIVFENNKFEFKLPQATNTHGFWIETYWYWFGYSKLHLDDTLTKDISDRFQSVFSESDAAEVISHAIPDLNGKDTLMWSMGKALYYYGGSKFIDNLNSEHHGIWFGTWAYIGSYGPWAQ
ncbi:hypothetical protein [Williamsoniiplasma lucivorax]|uniref:Uncharacterized protein n=1 Tax=Williamsoniiplasma lucivorax TaxID=209274 RepID=A0A2S5RF10_9MOLU|nr:hypothetical protein [Williamsoniiplasma lucivorax]PPE05916.1 hypothetical protein ELUCI_v1c02060 [Williamsoniiplasma lucivorax]